jgi:hypothetical protein
MLPELWVAPRNQEETEMVATTVSVDLAKTSSRWPRESCLSDLASRARAPLPAPTRPNERWSMDFVSARLADGRWFRTLTVLDVCTLTRSSLPLVIWQPGGAYATIWVSLNCDFRMTTPTLTSRARDACRSHRRYRDENDKNMARYRPSLDSGTSQDRAALDSLRWNPIGKHFFIAC